MKKLLSILLVLTCLFGLFTTASAQDFSAGYDGSEVTITFYHTMGANLTAVLDQYIAEFNTLYPNIHVEYSSEGSYDDVRDKVSTEITVGATATVSLASAWASPLKFPTLSARASKMPRRTWSRSL